MRSAASRAAADAGAAASPAPERALRYRRRLLWSVPVIGLLFLCLLGLGVWQLQRGEQKDALRQEFGERRMAPAVDLNHAGPLRRDAVAMRWRPVSLEGDFVRGTQLLLDNRIRSGQPGYFVYAPYRLRDEPLQVLVNRGWHPAGPVRDRLQPLPALPRETGQIYGRAVSPPSSGLDIVEQHWEELEAGVYRLPRLHLAEVEERLDLELLPFVVQWDASPSAPLVRDWKGPQLSGVRNRAYAAQWFSFAVLLLIYAFLVLWRRERSA